jgi:hypothetical protein
VKIGLRRNPLLSRRNPNLKGVLMDFDLSQVPYIKACVDLCVAVYSGVRTLQEMLPVSLSESEKTLLIAAVSTGHVEIIKMNSIPHIFAGGIMFQDDASDNMRAAMFRKAFQSLCARGYIEPPMEPDGLFPVSYDGLMVAKNLAQQG